MKFRLYSKQLRKFVPPDEYFVNGSGDVFFMDMMEGELVKAPEDSFIIQLGTRECDVNGLHLYEGDVVKSIKDANSSMVIAKAFGEFPLEREYSFIKYYQGTFHVCGGGGRVNLFEYYCCNKDPWGLEVIGNIFDPIHAEYEKNRLNRSEYKRRKERAAGQ